MQKALETRTIEIAPLAYMRGRTLADAFVILDEAQNATAAQMKMFLTRLGVNSKTVITGDKTQIDLPKREESGLMQIERILHRHRRHRVPLSQRDRRRSPSPRARDHQGVRRGRRRLNAMAGWLGGGDADDGSPRARALRFHGMRALIALVVAAVTYLVFPASPVVDSPILEVGSVAPDNVIAPFGYTVLKSSEELAKEQNDIARSVEPIFSVVPAALDSSRALVDQFDAGAAARGRRPPMGNAHRPCSNLARRLGVRLTPAEAQYLATYRAAGTP